MFLFRCRFLLFWLLVAIGGAPHLASAQSVAAPGRGTDAAATALALEKLTVLGAVLYIAAHPDDENTRLIAYYANERRVRTGYLSLTRGDGGQNLIGSELREKLGLIRTQELLAARRIDGGEQFFTRANDFGFSKTPTEALRVWDKEQVLADVVRTIRRFRPDVIITRFSPEPMPTHGHHTASAQLAVEAFSAAADPKRFPEQLTGSEKLEVWQAKRIFWNTSSFFFENNPNFDKTGLVTLDVGGYNALLGKSYGEIAALSRSQHRSQGFGSAGTRGEALEYFKLLAGDPLPPEASKPGQADLLAGVDLTWGRVSGGEKTGKRLARIVAQFNPAKPEALVQELIRIQFDLLLSLSKEQSELTPTARYWRVYKLGELNDVITRCTGVFARATVDDWALTPGQTTRVTIEIVRRTPLPLSLTSVKVPELGFDSSFINGLALNKPLLIKLRRPVNLPLSHPYWLREEPTTGMYRVSDPAQISVPENASALTVRLLISPVAATTPPPAPPGSKRVVHLDDVPVIQLTLPVTHRRVDPADGEIYRPLSVVPPVAVRMLDEVLVFADTTTRLLRVRVRASRKAATGYVKLQLRGEEPEPGWRDDVESAPRQRPFTLPAGADTTLTFRLRPGKFTTRTLRAVAVLTSPANVEVSTGEEVIHYPHIPEQVLFPEATARLVRADIKRGATNRVGYVVGAGDDVPAALRGLGYTVTLLGEGDLTPTNLRTFDAVVLGIRAWNTLPWLPGRQPALLAYVAVGGTLITQYNTSQGLVGTNLGPFPLKVVSKRITDETAAVEFLHPDDPLMQRPNRLTPADFQGWVQEQGLYYPEVFDPKYTALLRSHDPDEAPLDGALLVARYGKGTYVYTGLSFFRQLPAGVPGALRLFANLLAGSR